MTAQHMTEWTRRRFGLFIHWGLYALPARHEWNMQQESRTVEDYARYLNYFDPDLFDARDWARQAKAAGMQYVVLTAKHHEGFCLWDTPTTDYSVMHTPFGRDIIKEYVEAFRAEGLMVGFYYSLLDWHHPKFPIDVVHPLRNHPDAEVMNQDRDMAIYRQYMLDQVTELLTNYGTIDILWFDFTYGGWNAPEGKPSLRGKGPEDWGAEALFKRAREINPDIIINNRTGLDGDFVTPEQYQPSQGLTDAEGRPILWEACQTFSGSWGYHRDEMSWKSPKQLIDMLIKTVASGGNLLLNVGPTGRGVFDARAEAALAAIGEWMRFNRRSIIGCGAADGFVCPDDCRLTQNGHRLYIHLLNYPFGSLRMEGLAEHIEYAQFLHDASEIQYRADDHRASDNMVETVPEGTVEFSLPTVKPDTAVPVIEVFLKK